MVLVSPALERVPGAHLTSPVRRNRWVAPKTSARLSLSMPEHAPAPSIPAGCSGTLRQEGGQFCKIPSLLLLSAGPPDGCPTPPSSPGFSCRVAVGTSGSAWLAQTNAPFYNGFYSRGGVGYTLLICPLLPWEGSWPGARAGLPTGPSCPGLVLETIYTHREAGHPGTA